MKDDFDLAEEAQKNGLVGDLAGIIYGYPPKIEIHSEPCDSCSA